MTRGELTSEKGKREPGCCINFLIIKSRTRIIVDWLLEWQLALIGRA